ncbi:HpsJ family protein [Nodularia sp. UHCC 0506]|uniref:hormogonium polysaccharide biosynthesis protein HpsJ n=1 Tax=Nodularia sp. UHCC 0506 TaxID=3110243 RepID=UPI002B1ECB5B|nr:HpsJ family protein [Nodularia sp. UHCC 0506]MEA5516411.1 HpsJ family protein [Nodularia sp. UHCC 0506]
MTNRVASGNAALTLKVVGIILVLSFLLDFLILLLPFQPTNRTWQINLATALVDRGIVPLVGIGMLFVGYWIDSVGDSDLPKPIDIRFPVLILSSILGLIFLLIFPLHLNNVRQASAQNVNQIRQDAEQAENQLQSQLSQFQAQINNEQGKAQLEQLRNQARSQFSELLKNEQTYQQALNNPQIPAAQKELLKKFKENPAELDTFIAQQTDPQALAAQRVIQIRQRKEEAEKQAKDNAWKSGLRIGISSLLLSIGYMIIGWTGLRSMGALQGGKRKVAAR